MIVGDTSSSGSVLFDWFSSGDGSADVPVDVEVPGSVEFKV